MGFINISILGLHSRFALHHLEEGLSAHRDHLGPEFVHSHRLARQGLRDLLAVRPLNFQNFCEATQCAQVRHICRGESI